MQTSLAGNEVQLVRETPRSFLIKTSDYTISYDPESRDDGKGWVLIRREGKEHGLAKRNCQVMCFCVDNKSKRDKGS